MFTILFVFGLILLITVLFMYRRDKKKILPLTEQIYQDGKLSISVLKEKRKVRQIIVEVLYKKKEIQLHNFFVELAAADKSKKEVSLKSLLSSDPDEKFIDEQGQFYAGVSYDKFEELLSTIEFPAVALRFVAESSTGKKYKSHRLTISDRWGLLRVDSGNYN